MVAQMVEEYTCNVGTTLFNPMDCSPPGSSVHGIFQARVLEWVAISFSRGSSQPRDRTWVSCIVGRCFLPSEPPGKPMQCRRPGFTPRVGIIPWRKVWQPIPVLLLGESPWTEEPGGLQSMGLQRVGHDWTTNHTL